MRDFVITFGVATNGDLGPLADEDAHRRRAAIYRAAFTLGPAWSGNQSAIFVRTELGIDDVMSRLTPLIGDSDILLVAELTPQNALRFAGMVFDNEGFEVMFPQVVETPLSR